MSVLPAGSEVDVTVTYLEMTARPAYDRPSLPLGPAHGVDPGRGATRSGISWTSTARWARPTSGPNRFDDDREALRTFVQDPSVTLYTLLRTGWPAGFFLLDARQMGSATLLFRPGASGDRHETGRLPAEKPPSTWGWDRPGVERMTVNTCTLDHPRALGLYQKAGFAPVGQKTYTRVLSQPRPSQTATGDVRDAQEPDTAAA